MTPSPTPPSPLVVIGFGAMASGVVEGAIRAGVLDASRVHAADPSPDSRRRAESLGCAAHWPASHAVSASPRDAPVLLAVKPQSLPEVASELGGEVADRAILSILAGAPCERVASALRATRVVRVMPNTPARIGKGISAIAPGPGATPRDAEFAHALFGAVGQAVDIDESLMDAFTAIAGSGPAYVFYLAEAMIHAATQTGFDNATAEWIVRAVVEGSAGLLASDLSRTPEQLRAAVTSKGGTTAAATGVLDAEGVRASVVRAIVAARDRGRSLGGTR